MVIHTEKLNVMLRLNTSYRNKFFVAVVKVKFRPQYHIFYNHSDFIDFCCENLYHIQNL